MLGSFIYLFGWGLKACTRGYVAAVYFLYRCSHRRQTEIIWKKRETQTNLASGVAAPLPSLTPNGGEPPSAVYYEHKRTEY